MIKKDDVTRVTYESVSDVSNGLTVQETTGSICKKNITLMPSIHWRFIRHYYTTTGHNTILDLGVVLNKMDLWTFRGTVTAFRLRDWDD